MKSSGIKRGMAAFAIAAVAVTGIPALITSASADSINQMSEEGVLGLDEVRLYNSENNFEISTKPDGTDSTVRLQAGAGRNVDNIRFEYSVNGGATWNTAGDAIRNDDGSFFVEWATPPVGFVLDLRARDITPAGVGDTSTKDNIEVFGADPNTETINILAESQKGYYDSEDTGCFNGINFIMSGTTSVTSTSLANAPRIGTTNADAPNTANFDANDFEDIGNLQTGNFADHVSPSGKWSGYVDLDNYDFADAAGEFPDQVVGRLQTDVGGIFNETEDFEAYTLYSQAITTVTVTDDSNGNGGLPTSVTVLVADQNAKPVAGAEVVQSTTGAVDITDSRGEAHFDQFTNPVGGTQYFADNDCSGIFQAGAGDVTAPPFLAGGTATNMNISSAPEGRRPVGSSTTETVTITNAAGAAIVGRQVRFTSTGADGDSEVVFRTTDSAGKASYVVTCDVEGTISVQAAIQDPNGSGTPLPSDPFNRFANDKIGCGIPVAVKKTINPSLKSKNTAGGNDLLTVRAKAANGAAVKIYKIVGRNRLQLVSTGNLNANGVLKVSVNDTNGTDITAYKAVVSPTSDTRRGVTNRAQQAKTR